MSLYAVNNFKETAVELRKCPDDQKMSIRNCPDDQKKRMRNCPNPKN